jgi:nucleoside-diphosphate-sugar epimerase
VTVLVTGGTGRVGSRFVPRLLASGERSVRLLVRDPDRAEELADRGAELVVGDLLDADAVRRAVDGVDAIVHLGVLLTALLDGASDADVTAVNRDATIGLARAAADAGVGRFGFVSTGLVYGPGNGRPTRESDPLRPTGGIYPTSKAEAEQAVLDIHRETGLDVRIARLGFVYGDGDPHLPDLLGLREGNQSLGWGLRWPAHQRMHMVHHADVAQALIRLLRTDGLAGRSYNVADDAPLTVAELYAVYGEPLPDGAAERTLDDPWSGILDTTKTRTDLGFRPSYPTVWQAFDAGAL